MSQLSAEAAPGFNSYPDHKVIIQPSASRIRVMAGEMTVAESCSAMLVEESRHDAVYYLPRADVAMELLQASDTTSYCPFKGYARYWSLNGNAALVDSIWSYESPYRECAEISSYLAFYPDRFSVLVESPAS